MRSLVVGAFVALFSFVLPSQANHSLVPATCQTTESEFMASAKNLNAAPRVANGKAKVAIVEAINAERAKKGLWLFEVDDLMVGLIQREGKLLVGIVMFKDHCVVPGSVIVATAMEFISFITGLGLSMDDFVAVKGA
jgi:hypothetical protein